MHLKSLLVVGLASVLLGLPARAHLAITTNITFERQISRIFSRRCISCHRPGGAAFSMLSYQDVRPWAKIIEREVLARRMPPWGPVKGFAEFRDDPSLTAEEIEQISRWVEGGAPDGDSRKLLAPVISGESAKLPPRARKLEIEDRVVMNRGVDVIAILPVSLPERGTVMVTATRPDGSVEPLLWVDSFRMGFAQPFWYRRPPHLPSGSRIEVVAPSTSRVTLFLK